jgi:hypothetical protein
MNAAALCATAQTTGDHTKANTMTDTIKRAVR